MLALNAMIEFQCEHDTAPYKIDFDLVVSYWPVYQVLVFIMGTI